MGHKKRASLKATLQSQQSRWKAKQKAENAAQVAEQRRKTSKDKAVRRRPTVPFQATDHVLLVGEGNFSFARALVVDAPPPIEHLVPANITATSYDSREECFAKYPDAEAIVDAIEQRGVQVLFGIDATKLQTYRSLKGKRWDRIVWNFPHSGKGITDQDRNILSNQRLVLDFLRSAPHCLALGPIPAIHSARERKQLDDEDEVSESDNAAPTTSINGRRRGTVLITLRNVPPYTAWDIPRLAKSPPKPTHIGEEPNPCYKLLRSFVFHRELWKGYQHRMTKGERVHGEGKTGEGGEDRTWEFCLLD